MTTYHTLLGFCDWDLPAAIVLLAVIGILVYSIIKLRKREKELTELVEETVNDSQNVMDAAEMAVPYNMPFDR